MKKPFAIMGTNTGSIAVARSFLLLSHGMGWGGRSGGAAGYAGGGRRAAGGRVAGWPGGRVAGWI